MLTLKIQRNNTELSNLPVDILECLEEAWKYINNFYLSTLK